MRPSLPPFDEWREVVWSPPRVEDHPGQRFELRVDPEALRKAIEAAGR